MKDLHMTAIDTDDGQRIISKSYDHCLLRMQNKMRNDIK